MSCEAWHRSAGVASLQGGGRAGRGRRADPLEMVTEEKQRRLRRAAEAWLDVRPELAQLAVGFDVVAVRGGRLQRVPQAF